MPCLLVGTARRLWLQRVTYRTGKDTVVLTLISCGERSPVGIDDTDSIIYKG